MKPALRLRGLSDESSIQQAQRNGRLLLAPIVSKYAIK